MKKKHITRIALLISLATFTPAAFCEDTVVETTTTKIEVKAVVQPGSLTTKIADSVTFSTLTKALKASGLDMVLGGNDEFTVFAPTDEAFGKLPAKALAKLMLPENKEKLRSLLLYHVVAGKTPAADLKDGEVKTMNGEKIKVDADKDKVEINGAKVFGTEMAATNGVVHSIGKVLVPKSLDEFAGLDR
jgi:uncharacterized surface protein with fasciclin (FAS1) repeats